MHELSIAEAVVAVASRHAGGRRVLSVQLRVGRLRQVVPSALEFSFELLTSGTPLDGARLELEDVPARGRCRTCGSETTLSEFPLRCGRCGGPDLELVSGEELLVDSLEVEEEEMATEGMTHGC